MSLAALPTQISASDFQEPTTSQYDTISSTGYGGYFNSSSGGEFNCIPEEECKDVCFDRPSKPLGSGDWVGGNGNPHAFDDDPRPNPDDSMGGGTIGANGEARVEVCNNGGELTGSNGADLGSLGCIEVYMQWTYWVWASYGWGVEWGAGGIGGGGGHWVRMSIRSDEIAKVCPC